MIGIYLCDDDDKVRHQIQTALEWKIVAEDYDMKIACSAASAQELLDGVKNGKQGIYFLDVDLKDPQWDGFLLGRELRRRDPHGILVYITSYKDLAWRTFQYHLEAFDYLVKGPEPMGPAAVQCLEKIHARLLDKCQAPEGTFTLRTGDMERHVPLCDILYFETASTPHHILLHTFGSRMDFLGSLNELEDQLGDAFIRVHRSYLVSADKITAVDLKHNKLLIGEHECLLSRVGKAKLRRKMAGSP